MCRCLLCRLHVARRRSGGPAATASAKGKDNKERLKDQRYLYLSIDEAGTHVGVRRFRLLVGVYDADGQVLLGTGISAAIRVLANNDVPSGAAYIVLEVPIRCGTLPQVNPCCEHRELCSALILLLCAVAAVPTGRAGEPAATGRGAA